MNTYTVELLGVVARLVPSLLVEDGVNSDSGLSGLSVADDKLTLASANGDHGIDGLVARHHGLVDGAAGENAWGLHLGSAALSGLDRTFAVDRVSEGIDNTAEESLSDGNVDNLACALHGVTFFDQSAWFMVSSNSHTSQKQQQTCRYRTPSHRPAVPNECP